LHVKFLHFPSYPDISPHVKLQWSITSIVYLSYMYL